MRAPVHLLAINRTVLHILTPRALLDWRNLAAYLATSNQRREIGILICHISKWACFCSGSWPMSAYIDPKGRPLTQHGHNQSLRASLVVDITDVGDVTLSMLLPHRRRLCRVDLARWEDKRLCP